MDVQVRSFLDRYLATLSASERERVTSFSAEHFCADEESADLCSALIRDGINTATCSLKHWYLTGETRMPSVGHLQVVLNWAGEPTSVIEITSVSECRFREVDEAFAYAEGEGDRSLAYWRRAHWSFFERERREAGIVASEEVYLIQERFKVVY